MENNLFQIRTIHKDDVSRIVIAFNEPLGFDGSFERYINRWYEENKTKERITLIAFLLMRLQDTLI